MPNALVVAAFGDQPGRWPLPRPTTADEHWYRAVAAGGLGRYATARADLAVLLRPGGEGRLRSLAASTWGSFLRQMGRHRDAARWDGEALALAGRDPEAAVDALVGLAADALGVGRLAAAADLLGRAEQRHQQAIDPPARLAIRLAWVGAELAMAGGRGQAALDPARRAVALAGQAGPALLRHAIKSEMVLAAALCCAGDLPGARPVADAALERAAVLGLVPLCWALSCLLGDIGSAAFDGPQVHRIRAESATFIQRHGGPLDRG